MFTSVENMFIFPAPQASYGSHSYARHLCWIPWNYVISPDRAGDEQAADGIPCLWFPAPRAATVIVYFHANAEDLGMSYALLKHMRDQFKVNVLAVEYPGYGLLSHMTPSEEGVYEVARTGFRYLVDRVNVRYSQIILFGRSLGSGPAVHLAAQYPIGGLILVSAFSSLRAAVRSIAGRLLAWTVNDRFPNSQGISNVSCSTLFIHGESDRLIPVEHSLRLFKRCRARKLLVTPPKMEHNSNLFGDAAFLAVPAIHFFGFPGYYTQDPPRLPARLFEPPDRRLRLQERAAKEALGSSAPCAPSQLLCNCLAKDDPHHLDFDRPRIPDLETEQEEARSKLLSGQLAGPQEINTATNKLRSVSDFDATLGEYKQLGNTSEVERDLVGESRSGGWRSGSAVQRISPDSSGGEVALNGVVSPVEANGRRCSAGLIEGDKALPQALPRGPRVGSPPPLSPAARLASHGLPPSRGHREGCGGNNVPLPASAGDDCGGASPREAPAALAPQTQAHAPAAAPNVEGLDNNLDDHDDAKRRRRKIV